VGPNVSKREREQRVPVQGGVLLGRGIVLAVGWNGSRGPVSYFSFSFSFPFFVFLISFIDFAKMFQITSNHFQRFCKIPCKVFKSIGNKFSRSKQDFLKEIEIEPNGFCLHKVE
jgi:hypothetical protein